MAYDTELADRVRHGLAAAKAKKVTEREMFGGIAFMVAGNMACGIRGDELMVRVDPTLFHDALTRPNAHELQMGNRTMKGYVGVTRAGTDDDAEFDLWLRLGLAYAQSLPAKKAPAKKKPAAKKSAVKRQPAPKKAVAKEKSSRR